MGEKSRTMPGTMDSCSKFIFLFKDERYETQVWSYHGNLLREIKESFHKGADAVNKSRKKKNDRERRKSRGGIVSAIRRKLSTEATPLKSNGTEADIFITENDVELLKMNVEQNGTEITITVLNDIDPKWFRKSTKIFFQIQLLQRGII